LAAVTAVVDPLADDTWSTLMFELPGPLIALWRFPAFPQSGRLGKRNGHPDVVTYALIQFLLQ